ncbi:hypothetical protein V6N11_027757 [Hibiscus sabdariffa]|uniref:Uncharacterized protein n=1 Tax=Hibiscus sabdariffa TaxID=183260 RepID=A0ABR2NU73_9ROSI
MCIAHALGGGLAHAVEGLPHTCGSLSHTQDGFHLPSDLVIGPCGRTSGSATEAELDVLTSRGKKITLAPLTPSQVSEDQRSLKKSIKAAKNSYLLAELPADLPAPIVSLLQEFEDVFSEETSKGLPPLRALSTK